MCICQFTLMGLSNLLYVFRDYVIKHIQVYNDFLFLKNEKFHHYLLVLFFFFNPVLI